MGENVSLIDGHIDNEIKQTNYERIRNMSVEEMADNVNHPAHYESGQFECIDVMLETQGAEAVKDFCICNAFKYLYRHRRKNGSEDIAKAKWYLDKYLEIGEEQKNEMSNT